MELARLWDYMARRTKIGRETGRKELRNSSQSTEISTLMTCWGLGGLYLA